jgi:PAS domain S-box-containing protein
VYAQTDPNVLRFGLQTYVGKRVSLGSEHVGSVCVLYKEDHTPQEKDLELLGIAATAIAVEEKRRHAEEMMRASEQRYRSLFQRNLAGVYRTMLDGRIMDCNDSFARVFGYTCREEVLSHLACNLYKSVEDRKAFTSRLQEKHTVTNLEGSLLRKDGNPVWVLENASLVNDEDGTPLIEGTLIDITERKLAEEQIKASLKEKEVLLKEIHHRVKNNMQVISSLLSLQANRAGSQEVVDMFKESQNRVKSMALIHEKLYQSRDLARIDFGEYIRNLAGNLFRTYNVRSVALETDVEDIHFGVDTAIPCGLIINELISNSLKHAFPNGMSGRLFIGMHHAGTNMYRLRVKDDGIGFPENVSFQATESLGLQLVMTLTQQLHGEIELDKDHGTSFSIIFEVKQ